MGAESTGGIDLPIDIGQQDLAPLDTWKSDLFPVAT